MKKGTKIVVIENDESIVFSVKEALELEGYAVEIFHNGKAALNRLRHDPTPCLVLLDMIMPIMDGWEFMKEFLKFPQLTILPVPVYLFTVVTEKQADIKKLGAQGFIKKPVNLEYLIGIVNDHCKKTVLDRAHC